MNLIPQCYLESNAEIEALKKVLDQKGIEYRIGENNDNMLGMIGRGCEFLFPPRVWGRPEDEELIESLLEEVRAKLPSCKSEEEDTAQAETAKKEAQRLMGLPKVF